MGRGKQNLKIEGPVPSLRGPASSAPAQAPAGTHDEVFVTFSLIKNDQGETRARLEAEAVSRSALRPTRDLIAQEEAGDDRVSRDAHGRLSKPLMGGLIDEELLKEIKTALGVPYNA
jgi:hypothetical protein